jgi:hypothetical protein
MANNPSAMLRIFGVGEVPVEQVKDFLASLSHCYESIYSFDHAISIITDGARFDEYFGPRTFSFPQNEDWRTNRGTYPCF